MQTYDTVNDLENQSSMKKARKQRKIFTAKDYLEHTFLSGDKKEEFIYHVNSLRPTLNRLDNVDRDLRKESLALGRRGLELLSELIEIKASITKGRISIKGYFQAHFGIRANRIYEAIAMAKAVQTGAPSELSMTQLQILGSALGSKDEKRRNLARECIEAGKLPNDTRGLAEVSIKEFFTAFRSSDQNNLGDPEQILKKLISLTKEVSSLLNSVLEHENFDSQICKLDDSYKLKTQLLSIAETIESFDNKFTKKVILQ